MGEVGRVQLVILLATAVNTHLNNGTREVFRGKEEGRVTNVKPSTIFYEWMVYIERHTNAITKTPDCREKLTTHISECTGSIISRKGKVLTSAHCICKYYDRKNKPLTRYCLHNGNRRTPQNQQTGEKDRALNYLKIFVGNLNYKRASQVNVYEAYVMITNKKGNKVTINNGFDVGLILPDPKNTKIKRLQHLNLPKQNANFKDRLVTLAGWGRIHDEVKDRNGKISSSSCMTNNQGPIGDHFKPCNPKFLVSNKKMYGHACPLSVLVHYPPVYQPILKKCDDYWNWAQESLGANQLQEFSNADIIQVFDISDGHDYKCYRTENFDNPGWCKIEGDSWGFCSESCKFFGKPTLTKVYHETDKILRSRKYCGVQDLRNDATTCVTTVYPTNSVWLFTRETLQEELTFEGKKPIEIKTPIEIKLKGKNKKYIFTSGCAGDSGAPLWIPGSNVIVAIYRSGKGKGACGAETGFHSEYVSKLTHREINRWIKRF